MSIKNKINNITFQTQLLESVGWDESLVDDLFDYLDKVLNSDVVSHPSVVLKEIKDKFGEETEKIIKKLSLAKTVYKLSMLKNNLKISIIII